LLVWQTVEQIRLNINTYEGQVQNVLDDLIRRVPLDSMGIDRQEAGELFRLPKETARWLATTITGLVTTLLSNGLLVALFMVFLMTGRVTPSAVGGSLLWHIEQNVKRYLVRKVLISAVTGVLIGIVLTILGVPLAFVFGVLTFFLNFIPSIGSIIATLLPMPVVVLNPELGLTTKILAFVIPSILQFVMGNILDPKIMGRSLDLHPVVVLLGLMFFGMIWGIIGMFLATPIMAVIKIVLEQIPVTAPVAAALAGRLDRALAGFRMGTSRTASRSSPGDFN
jgi:AI-2 transport protein TqsA